MADNYLERRMEELRAPRTSTFRPQTQRIGLGWNLPKLRVIIIGRGDVVDTSIAEGFADAGSRVCLISDNTDVGNRLARKGIRFCHVDTPDNETWHDSMTQTLAAWRDTDVVICHTLASEQQFAIAKAWSERRKQFPAVSDYVGRFISILAPADQPATQELTDILLPLRTTFNKIVVPEEIDTKEIDTAATDERRKRAIATIVRTCQYLALPDSAAITAALLPITV